MGFGVWSWISVKAGLSLCYVNCVQYYGFMLYRTTLPRNVPEPTPLISPLNGIHDRAYVSVNGVSRPLVWVTLTQCFVYAMVSQTLQQCVLPKKHHLQFKGALSYLCSDVQKCALEERNNHFENT